MAARFEYGDILDQYPGTLSGGEQQRVALERAR
jgi:molybdate transport system ATP-binding protein